MTQQIAFSDNLVRVSLSGSIYVHEASQLRQSLLGYTAKGYNIFIIDVKEVDYIDSSGLGALVAIHKRALQNGGSVIIHGLQGLVKDVFELTRLTQVFEIR